MTNKQRAARAMKAIRAYPAYEKADLESSIVDLITDLLHLAFQKGLDLDLVVRASHVHFEVEQGYENEIVQPPPVCYT